MVQSRPLTHGPEAQAQAQAKAEAQAAHAMTSTWQSRPFSALRFEEKALKLVDVLPDPAKKLGKTPTGKVPYYPQWRQNAMILPAVLAPILAQLSYMKLTKRRVPFWAILVMYTMASGHLAGRSAKKARDLGYKYGFLDGEVDRDGVPDAYTRKIFWSVVHVPAIRPIMACLLAYRKRQAPSFSLSSLAKFLVYPIVLDFWFYVYHRLSHEIPWLWKYHSLHHKTKHPNVLLSSFGDTEQEWGDSVGIPLLTYLTLRPDFYTFFAAQMYILNVEVFGHSGLRIYAIHPILGRVLRWFNCSLTIEDHDLHHRHGWRKARGYGKQTLIWDTLFGTRPKRVEATEDNIDWVNTAS